MKYQVLFSLENNEKVSINVLCCSHDWATALRAKTSKIVPAPGMHYHYEVRHKFYLHVLLSRLFLA